jgi:hypothetical protein
LEDLAAAKVLVVLEAEVPEGLVDLEVGAAVAAGARAIGDFITEWGMRISWVRRFKNTGRISACVRWPSKVCWFFLSPALQREVTGLPHNFAHPGSPR